MTTVYAKKAGKFDVQGKTVELSIGDKVPATMAEGALAAGWGTKEKPSGQPAEAVKS